MRNPGWLIFRAYFFAYLGVLYRVRAGKHCCSCACFASHVFLFVLEIVPRASKTTSSGEKYYWWTRAPRDRSGAWLPPNLYLSPHLTPRSTHRRRGQGCPVLDEAARQEAAEAAGWRQHGGGGRLGLSARLPHPRDRCRR